MRPNPLGRDLPCDNGRLARGQDRPPRQDRGVHHPALHQPRLRRRHQRGQEGLARLVLGPRRGLAAGDVRGTRRPGTGLAQGAGVAV